MGASRCPVSWAIPIALGVHPPSPSAFAPWSSQHLVACFHAPRRLPAWLSNTILLAMARKSARWKHPCDLSRGRAFLWTVPSQHVYLLNLFSYAIVNMIHKASLASPLHASSWGFSFPHPPTPTPPPLICTQTQPGRGGLVEGGSSASPSAFAPWSSRRLVTCFHAPRRLPAWLSNTILLAMARKSARSFPLLE